MLRLGAFKDRMHSWSVIDKLILTVKRTSWEGDGGTYRIQRHPNIHGLKIHSEIPTNRSHQRWRVRRCTLLGWAEIHSALWKHTLVLLVLDLSDTEAMKVSREDRERGNRWAGALRCTYCHWVSAGVVRLLPPERVTLESPSDPLKQPISHLVFLRGNYHTSQTEWYSKLHLA